MTIGKLAVIALAGLFTLGSIGAVLADRGRSPDPVEAVTLADDQGRKQDGDDELALASDEDEDEGDGDDTTGDDGTRGGDNTGDGDNTRGDDGTRGSDNTFTPTPAPAPAWGDDTGGGGTTG